MDENLVGYLLKALDADTEQAVERYLRTHPESAQRLKRLQQVLEPLEADRPDPEPPRDLWVHTLARIAEYRCRELPPAPASVVAQKAAPRSRWRRADLLVAAALLLAVGGLATTGLNMFRHHHQVQACKENLHLFHHALASYGQQHNGAFPRVEAQPPRHVAGVTIPMLRDAGVLDPRVSVTCPVQGNHPPSPRSLQELEEIWWNDPAQYERLVSELLGCYAYSLGYRQPNGRGEPYPVGLRQDDGDIPVMADGPPFEKGMPPIPGNSPNHHGKGQNVLFTGGHVKFLRQRAIGDDDDIYLNRHHEVGAGVDRSDAVLGASWASPDLPEPD